MAQQSLFLDAVAPPLYLTHHTPEGEAKGVVLLLSPFAEEKKSAQRPLVETARSLAAAGWHAVRFDFRGTGDSQGEHGEFDLDHWRQDIRAAAAWARAAAAGLPLGLLGVRLGASLALEGGDELQAEWVALWEPIADGSQYMRQNLQQRAIRKMLTHAATAEEDSPTPEPNLSGRQEPAGSGGFPAFDFDGFWVNTRLHQQVSELKLLGDPPRFRGRVWLVQISASERPRPDMEALARTLQAGGARVEFNVYRLPPFWSRIDYVSTTPLREGLLQWLQPLARPAETT